MLFPLINVYKIAINFQEDIAKITVDEEIILPDELTFSDTFPRIITSFHPRDFFDCQTGLKYQQNINLYLR